KDFEFELTDYEIKLPDSLNILKVGVALLSEERLHLKDVSLIPRYGDFEYHRRVGSQTDVAKVHFPEIIFQGLNVEKLTGERMVEAASVRLIGAKVDVFRDKRFEFQQDVIKAMPQQLMMNAP